MKPGNLPDWRTKLPKINPNSRDASKLEVRALYKNEADKSCVYVAQGNLVDGEWLFWGYAIIPGQPFPIQITVSARELETGTGGWEGRTPCELDESFQKSLWLPIKNEHFPPVSPTPSGRARKPWGGRANPIHPHVLRSEIP